MNLNDEQLTALSQAIKKAEFGRLNASAILDAVRGVLKDWEFEQDGLLDIAEIRRVVVKLNASRTALRVHLSSVAEALQVVQGELVNTRNDSVTLDKLGRKLLTLLPDADSQSS